MRVDRGGHSCQAAKHQRREATPAGAFVFCLHRRYAFKGGEPIVILHVRKEPAAATAAANGIHTRARARWYIYCSLYCTHTRTHIHTHTYDDHINHYNICFSLSLGRPFFSARFPIASCTAHHTHNII